MKRFLLAEDNEITKRFCKSLIASVYKDAVFDSVSNGVEAFSKALENDYSVIISDIEMPVMTGIEFYRNLKEKAPRLLNRFIFISVMPEPYKNFLSSEGCLWLEKPFLCLELLCMVNRVLDNDGRPGGVLARPCCSDGVCKLEGKLPFRRRDMLQQPRSPLMRCSI